MWLAPFGCHSWCGVRLGARASSQSNSSSSRRNSKPMAMVTMLQIQLSASHIKTMLPLFPLVPPLTARGRLCFLSRSCSSAHDTLALRHVMDAMG